jgi:hypothetical protein
MAAAALALALTACGGYPGSGATSGTQYLTGFGAPPTPHAEPFANDDVSYWDGDAATGNPLIRINRFQQKAYFYKGGVLVGVSKVATGMEGYTTPAGSYKIIQKVPNYVSGTYGVIRRKATGEIVNNDATARVTPIPPDCEFVGAPMPFFMRFYAGYGMHEGFIPGYAASHGCIRMPARMVRIFYNSAPLGTPVIVE